MSQRDKLAGVVKRRLREELAIQPEFYSNLFWDGVTRAIAMADELGYSRPRVVETVEELEALPEGTTILDRDVTATKVGDVWSYVTGLFEPGLPATVLYQPEESND